MVRVLDKVGEGALWIICPIGVVTESGLQKRVLESEVGESVTNI